MKKITRITNDALETKLFKMFKPFRVSVFLAPHSKANEKWFVSGIPLQ